VVDGYPEASLQRINQLLAERQWQEVASYFDCQLGGARSSGADFEQTVTPHLLGSKLLSVSIFTSYYCGGAHPDFADNPLTLDVASGKRCNWKTCCGQARASRSWRARPVASEPTTSTRSRHWHRGWPHHDEAASCRNQAGQGRGV
jgi:hypothetical protein